jgi:hypothetical protein
MYPVTDIHEKILNRYMTMQSDKKQKTASAYLKKLIFIEFYI